MKALVKASPKPDLSYEDVPIPAIGRGDVLIKVLRTGICGTDLHIYAWDDWAQADDPGAAGRRPRVRRRDRGARRSTSSDFAVGDLVSGEGHVVCGRCRNCMAGRRHQCARTNGIGVNRAGAFAEYVALPMTNVWRHLAGHRPRRRGDLRPVRQRGAHRARRSRCSARTC